MWNRRWWFRCIKWDCSVLVMLWLLGSVTLLKTKVTSSFHFFFLLAPSPEVDLYWLDTTGPLYQFHFLSDTLTGSQGKPSTSSPKAKAVTDQTPHRPSLHKKNYVRVNSYQNKKRSSLPYLLMYDPFGTHPFSNNTCMKNWIWKLFRKVNISIRPVSVVKLEYVNILRSCNFQHNIDYSILPIPLGNKTESKYIVYKLVWPKEKGRGEQ